MIKKGVDCITYMLQKTQSRDFIRTASELQKTLTLYKQSKHFIRVTETSFGLTTAPYGVVGCLGDSSRASADSNKEFQKELHAQYFSTVGGIYLTMYDNLNNYVSYISEAVHQLSTESAMIPPRFVNDTLIIESTV